jgi:hypothetical protein
VKEYLRKDPAERKIIDRLDRPDIKVRISLVKDKVSAAVFNPIGVSWNPNMAYKSRASDTRLSPAIALGHELDHIYQAFLRGNQYSQDHEKPDAQYFRAEERRVITGSEASMLRTFYGEGPRPDYNIQPYPVSDPYSR